MKKDVIIYFIGKMIPALVNLAIIVLGVRFLGEEQYGKYSLIFSGVILISNFSFTWIQQSMVRFLSAYKENPAEPISRFFFLTLISTLVGAIILVFGSLFYFKLNIAGMLFVVSFTILFNLFQFRLTIYQTLIKPLKYAFYEGTYNLFLILFLIGFIYLFVVKNFLILFISMGLGLVFAEMIHRLFLSEKSLQFDIKKNHWNKDFTKKAMDYGFILTIWIFVFTVTSIADRYVIKEFRDYSAVGTYSAIKDLVTKISTFTILPIFLAFNAKINDAWNNGSEQKAIKLLKQALKIEFLVCVIVIAGFVLFRNLIYGKFLHLKGDGLILSSVFLIIGAFLWQGALIVHKPLELLMKQRTMVYALLSVLTINVGANLLFVPVYGFTAAAIVSCVSALIYVILTLILSKRNMNKHHETKNNQSDPSEISLLTQ